jgi:hypothetical protein
MASRTQLTLEPELQRRGRRRAAALGISFAEYVRRLIANDVGEKPAKPDVSIIFALGTSLEPTDIARDKDKLIGEAIAEDRGLAQGGR